MVLTNDEVVKVVTPPQKSGGWFGGSSKWTMELGSEEVAFPWDGRRTGEPLKGPTVAVAGRAVFVSTRWRDLALEFAGIVREPNVTWHLAISGQWGISDPKAFVDGFAAVRLGGRDALREDAIWADLTGELRPQVKLEVDSILEKWKCVENLVNQDALKLVWWQKKLTPALSPFGITVNVAKAWFHSPEREEAAKKVAEQARLDADQKLAAMKAEHEEALKKIESDKTISEQDRQHQLELVKKRHERELLQAQAEIARMQREAEEEKSESLARAEQARIEAEQKVAAMKAAHEEALRKIESDKTIGEQQRQHQLDLLNKRHEKEMLEAQLEVIRLQHRIEQEKADHEKRLAEAKHGAPDQVKDEIKQIGGKLDVLQKQAEGWDAVKTEMARFISQLQQSTAQSTKELVAQLAEHLERVTGWSRPGAENVAGVLLSKPAALEAWKRPGWHFPEVVEWLKRVPQRVTMKKPELRTRTVAAVKLNILRLHDSVRFSLESPCDGHLTVLNLGTSGDVLQHVPNAFCPVDKAEVKKGRLYEVPGPGLLPQEKLDEHGLSYVEIGPPGWERIVAIVTKDPLGFAVPSSPDPMPGWPLLVYSDEQYREILDRLTKHAEVLAAGELSFKVE